MTSPVLELRQAGLVIRRKKRDDEDAWQRATSWLGGLPTIAIEDWPRHRITRVPLIHLAQIDFSDFPSGPWSQYVPDKGALCFFISDATDNEFSFSVVHVSDPDTASPCHPPEDHPPIGGARGWLYEGVNRDRTRLEDARRAMRRWPVDFVPVSCSERDPNSDVGTEFDPPLSTILGPSPDYVPAALPEKGYRGVPLCLPDEVPWEAARRVVVSVQHNAQFNPAIDLPAGAAARMLDKLKQARRRQTLTQAFVDRWTDMAAGEDPYALMGADLVKSFDDELRGLRNKDVLSKRYHHFKMKLGEAGADVYKDMMLGSRGMYEKMPPRVRDRIDNEYRQTGWGYDGTHQAFGIGLDIQGELETFDNQVLLFQATFDNMMDWQWGDLGIHQFFISPDDLAARNWDGVIGDYTCG